METYDWILTFFPNKVPEEIEWKADGESQRMANNFSMIQWAKDNEEVWQSVVAKHGGHPEAFKWGTWDFFDWMIGKAWCTIGSVSKARKFGWMRYDDTYDTWIETFRSFENAGILPFQQVSSGKDHLSSKSIRAHPGDAVERRLNGNGLSSNGVVESD